MENQKYLFQLSNDNLLSFSFKKNEEDELTSSLSLYKKNQSTGEFEKLQNIKENLMDFSVANSFYSFSKNNNLNHLNREEFNSFIELMKKNYNFEISEQEFSEKDLKKFSENKLKETIFEKNEDYNFLFYCNDDKMDIIVHPEKDLSNLEIKEFYKLFENFDNKVKNSGNFFQNGNISFNSDYLVNAILKVENKISIIKDKLDKDFIKQVADISNYSNKEIAFYNYGNKYVVKPDRTLEAFAKSKDLDGQIKDVMKMSEGIFLKIEDKTEPDFKIPHEKTIVKDEYLRGEK